MIIVTVGTTYFEELIIEVDRLCGEGFIKDDVLSQIGSGNYIPKHMRWTRIVDNFTELLQSADLVISAGGATVFELLAMGKDFIAVPNRHVKDDHQAKMLLELESLDYCNCCWVLSNLNNLIKLRPKRKQYPKDPELPKYLWNDLLERISI